MQRSPENYRALPERSGLRLADHPNSAERLANICLAGLKQDELSPEEITAREFNVATVNSFEGKHTYATDLG